ncbi:hypothetical protein FJY84_06255, partial [Candidatus Bathyarchaeota archaeon]|nr:hypothetical protein [Candidatus Bathyarchaeota archaeon]
MSINKSFIKYPDDYYYNSTKILDTALNDLSAYKSWKTFDPGKENHIDERYMAIPVLTKKIIREYFPNGFVPHDFDIQKGLESGEINFVETSGSTDTKVTNIWYQKWWDASERASWKLNNTMSLHATGDHPEAILVNSVNVGLISDSIELPFEKRRISRFLYLNEKTNPQLWTSAHMNRIIRELSIFKPVILEANPSVLSKLTRYIFESKQSVYQPKAIVLTYEIVSDLQLWQIRRVFNVPIISSYGSTETGYVFIQCEEGKFHQNSDYCRVDFQPFKKEHGGPYLGRILVTPFHND